MIKKIIVFLIFSLSLTSGSWAFIIPQVYVGGAAVQKKSIVDFSSSSIKNENFDTSSILLNLGVRPLNLPILGGFRIEAQYLGAITGQNKDNQFGLVLYYDFLRFIPIVNPYLGVGTQYATYKFGNKSNISDAKSKGLYTFHAGLNASIPVLPLDLYVEYRYTASASKSDLNLTSYKINSNDFMIGARYYLLK